MPKNICKKCKEIRGKYSSALGELIEHTKEVENSSLNGVGHLIGVACLHKLSVALEMLLNFNLGCEH